MGNVSSHGKIFKWSIEGYSSIENNIKSEYYSGYFEAQGYRWTIRLIPGISFLRLGLCLDFSSLPSSLPSNVVLKVDYKLGLYDQLHGNHQWKRGNDYFARLGYNCRLSDMITMKRFKSLANGFLVNDGCLLSAEVTNVSPIIPCIGASECSSVHEKMISYSSRWTIRNFLGIQKPVYSEDFEAGRLNWHVRLEKGVNSIALFLELDKSTTLPPNSGVHVELTLCMMDQVKGNHKKQTGQNQFCSKFNSWGWRKFLDLEDLQNPSNGFLVNDTCIVEASVTVLGSSSYHDF